MGYFIATSNGRKGPFSVPQIRKLLAAGRVPPTLPVFEQESGRMITAGDVVARADRPAPGPAPSAARRPSSRGASTPHPKFSRRTDERASVSRRRGLSASRRRAAARDAGAEDDENGATKPRRGRPLTQRTGLVVTLLILVIGVSVGGGTLVYLRSFSPLELSSVNDVRIWTPRGWTRTASSTGAVGFRRSATALAPTVAVGSARIVNSAAESVPEEPLATVLAAVPGGRGDLTVTGLVVTRHRERRAFRFALVGSTDGVPLSGSGLAVFRGDTMTLAVAVARQSDHRALKPMLEESLDSLRFVEK